MSAGASGGAAARRVARQRAAERRAAAARHRRRTMIAGAAAVLGLAALVTVAILVQGARTATDAAAPAPAHTTSGTAFPVGSPDAPVTVEVYEDFLCPACRHFEETTGDTLRRLVDEGTIRVHYAPIAILDRASTDDYSTRALNAAAVVADEAGIGAFRAFHDLLFQHQPAEKGPGLSDDELVSLAREAGATGGSVASGIRERRFEDWSARVTDQASRRGVTGTPTVLVDGEPLADRTSAGLLAAVRAAGA